MWDSSDPGTSWVDEEMLSRGAVKVMWGARSPRPGLFDVSVRFTPGLFLPSQVFSKEFLGTVQRK